MDGSSDNFTEVEVDVTGLRECFTGRMYTDEVDTAPFLTDWRKQWVGRVAAVVQPSSPADVAAVVRWCAANDVAIVPQGGNTGLSGGATPDRSGRSIVMSVTKLNSIRAIDPVNNTITVDAGCTLQQVQEAAAQVGRYFPLSLAAEGTCTIGGNLATNAGGTGVLRFGNARDLCLGLEVVTASGEVWNGLRGLRKDNTGYDLKDLFVGSEGTLGVITGAVMKLFPQPAKVLCSIVSVPSISAAVASLQIAQQFAGQMLTGFELLSDGCVELVKRHTPDVRNPVASASPWYVLIELQLSEADRPEIMLELVERIIDAGLGTDAVVAESSRQVAQFWELRENISEAQAAFGPTIKHDVSVPISGLVAFVDPTLESCAAAFPDSQPVVFGHLGDGNLHFNFSPLSPDLSSEARMTFAQSLAGFNRIVHDAVRVLGGSISAEHGLGVLRRDEADQYRDPTATKLMLSIKLVLDPHGTMNPGKTLRERHLESGPSRPTPASFKQY